MFPSFAVLNSAYDHMKADKANTVYYLAIEVLTFCARSPSRVPFLTVWFGGRVPLLKWTTDKNRVNTNGIPFWGRCTTHFRTYFSGDWDVRWGYGLLTHGHISLFRRFKHHLFCQMLPF